MELVHKCSIPLYWRALIGIGDEVLFEGKNDSTIRQEIIPPYGMNVINGLSLSAYHLLGYMKECNEVYGYVSTTRDELSPGLATFLDGVNIVFITLNKDKISTEAMGFLPYVKEFDINPTGVCCYLEPTADEKLYSLYMRDLVSSERTPIKVRTKCLFRISPDNKLVIYDSCKSSFSIMDLQSLKITGTFSINFMETLNTYEMIQWYKGNIVYSWFAGIDLKIQGMRSSEVVHINTKTKEKRVLRSVKFPQVIEGFTFAGKEDELLVLVINTYDVHKCINSEIEIYDSLDI